LSEHKLADLMKNLLKVFYGQAPTYAFYDGCSTGGREGLLEAQQYPHDFNGIVSGAPASIHQPLNVWYQGWNALANQGPDGQPILTIDKLAPLHAAVAGACGGVNGLILDRSAGDFDPGSIQCPAGATDTSSCLTPAQVETVRKLYAGPRDDHGDLMYPGWPVKGSEANWAPWLVPATPGAPTSSTIDANAALNTIRYLAYKDIDPTLGLEDIPFTEAGFRQIMSQTSDIFDATNPDLTAFRDAGGKLILWHGWADPAISPVGTVAYYQAVQDHMGGPAATARFARLFMLPGVGHCRGGQGPDSFGALSAIVDWVEHGKAPDSFVTTKSPTSHQHGPVPSRLSVPAGCHVQRDRRSQRRDELPPSPAGQALRRPHQLAGLLFHPAAAARLKRLAHCSGAAPLRSPSLRRVSRRSGDDPVVRTRGVGDGCHGANAPDREPTDSAVPERDDLVGHGLRRLRRLVRTHGRDVRKATSGDGSKAVLDRPAERSQASGRPPRADHVDVGAVAGDDVAKVLHVPEPEDGEVDTIPRAVADTLAQMMRRTS